MQNIDDLCSSNRNFYFIIQKVSDEALKAGLRVGKRGGVGGSCQAFGFGSFANELHFWIIAYRPGDWWGLLVFLYPEVYLF